MNTIADRIKQAREKKKLTAEELARRLDIAPELLREWEDGLSEPDTPTAGRLADKLSVSVDYILFGQDNIGGVKTMFPKSAQPEKTDRGGKLTAVGAALLFCGGGGIAALLFMCAMSPYGEPGLGYIFSSTPLAAAFVLLAACLTAGAVLSVAGMIITQRNKSRGKRK